MIVFDQLKKNDPHLRAVTWGVLIGMAILVAGLWWVQIISYRHYSENQKAQSFRTVRIPAIRGKILDRNGAAMAENRPSYNVNLYLDELRGEFRAEYARARKPQLVTNSLPFWKRWLGFNPVESKTVRLTLAQRRALENQSRYRVASNSVFQVAQRLQQPVSLSFSNFMRHYTNQLALPLPVLTNIDTIQISRLLEQSSNPPGIDLEVQPMRHYPGGTTAAHILGYLGRDITSYEGELSDFSFRLPDYRGKIGVEDKFDTDLRGKAGVKSVLVNSLGYRQSENIWTPAEPGKNVVLTIDLAIQQAAEQALHNYSPTVRGAVVVLDCNNGDILAMASSPAFDPNWYIPFLKPAYSEFLNDETSAPQKNRATQMNYRPGSIFKIVSGLACLEAGLNPNEKIHCSGAIWIGRRRIDDLAPAGDYDFRRAFIKSSNAYFITNGLKYGFENVVKLGQQLHLGEKAGMPGSDWHISRSQMAPARMDARRLGQRLHRAGQDRHHPHANGPGGRRRGQRRQRPVASPGGSHRAARTAQRPASHPLSIQARAKPAAGEATQSRAGPPGHGRRRGRSGRHRLRGFSRVGQKDAAPEKLSRRWQDRHRRSRARWAQPRQDDVVRLLRPIRESALRRRGHGGEWWIRRWNLRAHHHEGLSGHPES
jgi:cell division protein FtsI/penicillin-binding protein 2